MNPTTTGNVHRTRQKSQLHHGPQSHQTGGLAVGRNTCKFRRCGCRVPAPVRLCVAAPSRRSSGILLLAPTVGRKSPNDVPLLGCPQHLSLSARTFREAHLHFHSIQRLKTLNFKPNSVHEAFMVQSQDSGTR